MTDQTPEQDTTPGVFAATADGKPLNVFSIEQVLSSARRVETTAHICLRADLQGRFDELAEQLGTLLDEDGNVRSDDDEPSLADVSDARRIQDEMEAVHEQMQANMWHVLFRAMESDDWEKFEKEHRPGGPMTAVKDPVKWGNLMIVACAVDPELTLDQVLALRKKFSNSQFKELAAKAYAANTTGGVDVPKLPLFSHSQKPQE